MPDVNTALQQHQGDGASHVPDLSDIEDVLIRGDLSKLSPDQRISYYEKVCTSVGLNPLTKPFEYIKLNGQLRLYAKKEAADQLRSIHGVSITGVEKETGGDLITVTAHATDKHGRSDVDTGVVSIGGLKGDRLANAIMKAVTKAKRRVTLSICGLGWLDETELETIPSAESVDVDYETGEIAPSVRSEGAKEEKQESKVDKVLSDIEERLRGADPGDFDATAVAVVRYISDWPKKHAARAKGIIEAVQDARRGELERARRKALEGFKQAVASAPGEEAINDLVDDWNERSQHWPESHIEWLQRAYNEALDLRDANPAVGAMQRGETAIQKEKQHA